MRILLTIPHLFDATGPVGGERRHGAFLATAFDRAAALANAINAIHQLFGGAQHILQIAQRRTEPANAAFRGEVHVVVCTTGGRHVLHQLTVSPAFFEHRETGAEPPLLGFECHAVLRDRFSDYDWYGYLEDDLVLHDPWLFVKLAWFSGHVGDEAVLIPNRFERGTKPLVNKAYIDGDLAAHVTTRWQNRDEMPELRSTVMGRSLLFRRPLNPHAGCFFLSAAQMGRWLGQPHFLDRDTSFVGPLESAATLGVMRTFRIYKPARENASFLEIEHSGTAFLDQLRPP
ncbi:MAG: calcium-binding protein [Planctomycetes bacterium]|nr:calcium-binding protein [Planctomycetota bacterium]